MRSAVIQQREYSRSLFKGSAGAHGAHDWKSLCATLHREGRAENGRRDPLKHLHDRMLACRRCTRERPWGRLVLLLSAILAIAADAGAQCVADSTEAGRIIVPRSPSASLREIRELLGCGEATLISGTTVQSRSTGPHPLHLVDPEATLAWNSTIPVSMNDGAVWAGAGTTLSVRPGAFVTYGPLTITLAPVAFRASNRAFPILTSRVPYASPFASPFHDRGITADLPLRFGNASYTRVDPGESSIEYRRPTWAAGVSSASQWWGPGIRNGLVVSTHAAGIPRAYVRTAKPWVTLVGNVEAYWFAGTLLESPFFDYNSRNDLRSVSGGIATVRLAADSGLLVGASRVVYASVGNLGTGATHFADVFTDWHRAPSTGDVSRRSDQMFAIFARWHLPAAGLSTHVEWAKLSLPSSLREFLVDPQRRQGYTLGLEWARAFGVERALRLQAEATMLEQTPRVPLSALPEFYASHTVPQGFTHQGQAVGAAIGPGSSSQYIGADMFTSRQQFGINVGRIRWEDGAFYRASPGGVAHYAHDVSLFIGSRYHRETRTVTVDVEAIRTWRLNYLFQTLNPYVSESSPFDVRNLTLNLRVTPHLSRPRRAASSTEP